jgi:hypothetical protein
LLFFAAAPSPRHGDVAGCRPTEFVDQGGRIGAQVGDRVEGTYEFNRAEISSIWLRPSLSLVDVVRATLAGSPLASGHQSGSTVHFDDLEGVVSRGDALPLRHGISRVPSRWRP